jgi:hypothetical protein
VARIEGYAVDLETGERVFYGVVKILDENDKEIVDESGKQIGTTSTDMRGEFGIDVPAGKRYKVCFLSQLYQPTCFKVIDDEGKWTELSEDGRRVRINTKRIALGGGAGV